MFIFYGLFICLQLWLVCKRLAARDYSHTLFFTALKGLTYVHTTTQVLSSSYISIMCDNNWQNYYFFPKNNSYHLNFWYISIPTQFNLILELMFGIFIQFWQQFWIWNVTFSKQTIDPKYKQRKDAFCEFKHNLPSKICIANRYCTLKNNKVSQV